MSLIRYGSVTLKFSHRKWNKPSCAMSLLVYLIMKLQYIEKLLPNHVTDTNKKIEHLEASTKEKFKEMKEDFKEFKEEIKTNNKEINNKFTDLNFKLDQLLSKKSP